MLGVGVCSLPSDALNIGHSGGSGVDWWTVRFLVGVVLTFERFRGRTGLTYINPAHLQEITNTYPMFFKVFLFPQLFPQNQQKLWKSSATMFSTYSVSCCSSSGRISSRMISSKLVLSMLVRIRLFIQSLI